MTTLEQFQRNVKHAFGEDELPGPFSIYILGRNSLVEERKKIESSSSFESLKEEILLGDPMSATPSIFVWDSSTTDLTSSPTQLPGGKKDKKDIRDNL